VERLLEQTLSLLSTLADRRRVSLEIVANGHAEWDFDGFQMQQALTNLLINGIQATPPGARVVTGYEIQTGEGGASTLRLYVKDEGTGMPRDVMERAFEPFFTTKEIGEGTGLGLSIAQGIVRDHGGWIEVESEVGKGSVFSIWLPKGDAG
jgi:signal transduction histidine kinase